MTAAVKWRFTIGLVLVFAAGVATGVFAGAWHAHRQFTGRHGGHMAAHIRARMQHELKLTPQQLEQLTPVLDETAKKLQEIRADSARRVSETITHAHEQLASHLTPEQQADLRKMVERRPRGSRGPRGHRGPPGDGAPPH